MNRWNKLWDRQRLKEEGDRASAGKREGVEESHAVDDADSADVVDDTGHEGDASNSNSEQAVAQGVGIGDDHALHQLPTAPGSAKSRSDKPLTVTKADYRKAVEECNKAKEAWLNAWRKFDWVVDPDQIDYAIYTVIAAEKHYTALLKEVKSMHEQLSP